MSITQYAIEKNRVTLVFILIVIFAGLRAFFTLPQAEDPGFTIRWAVIRAYFPGASPQRMEELVTDKIEQAIQEMPEIDYISSESRTGYSFIGIGVKDEYSDMRPIFDELRRKVEDVAPQLPAGVDGPYVDEGIVDVFGTIVTIVGEGFTYAELEEVADEVRDELLLIDEVAKINILGAQQEYIFVEYNNARLAELGVSPYQMQQILASQNIVNPGGDIKSGRERIILEPSGNFESIEDLKKTIVQLPGRTDVLYLGDITNIYRGYVDPPAALMRTSGEPCLGLSISLREDGNISILGEEVKETIKRLQKIYPIGIEFDFVAFQAKHVEQKVDDFINNLIQAIVVVVLVMIIFLGIKTGLIVATLIPMAMLMSLMLMKFFHIGLNQVSLAALIIALGMLVDNAIVMSESILVQISGGQKAVKAAIDSAKELQIPLLVASLTTAAAFLPIFLAPGTMGEYVGSLFSVVTLTLLSSWILAITMTPMLCAKFLKPKEDKSQKSKEPYSNKFYRSYRRGLIKMLKHPIMTLIAVFIIFMVAMQGFSLVPAMFMPPNDRPVFTAEFTYPIGTSIETTRQFAIELDEFIKNELQINEERNEGIINWSTHIGESAPRFNLSFEPEESSPGYCMCLLNASSSKVITAELMPKLEEFVENNFPSVRPRLALLGTGGGGGTPVEVRISGKNIDKLYEIVDSVKGKMRETPGTKNIYDNWGLREKKILVNIDQPRAYRAGLTSQDVAISLQTILSGMTVSQLREDDQTIPIMMRTEAVDRDNIEKLESYSINSQATGSSVPLKQIANLEVTWQPSKIIRWDRLKTISIRAGVEKNAEPLTISAELRTWLEEESKAWPLGYDYEIGGEAEESSEANQGIMDNLGIAAFIILMLLVMQFNSFRKPFIILVTIPLGLIGVVIGLIVARSYFGFMTLLGVVSLAGIVINNAIVLLDRIKIEIEENGHTPQTAIVEAGQRRMRPILLTTATTICGLIPLWLGGGPMWETMAIAIIFGLLFATALTLGVVPVLYSLFYKVKFKEYEYGK